MNIVSKVFSSNVRSLGARSVTTVCWTDMGKSKHEFVNFVNAAISNASGTEAVELYKYLNRVFINNDYNYDGLVGPIGFDAMVKEAAHAPRRFGFAPHASEMYDSEEAQAEAHANLFKELCADGDELTFSSWYDWSVSHIREKYAKLKTHNVARWERSPEDFASFFKGVAKESSNHCLKSSSSTQFKEFYLLTNQHFVAADSNNLGYVDAVGFNTLVDLSAEIPLRFGHNWYQGVSFGDVAVGGKITFEAWLAFNKSLVISKAAAL